VAQGSSGAVRFFFPNNLGGEGRVVGMPSIDDGLVKGFCCSGSEGCGCVESEFSVLFMPDDVRSGGVPSLGEGERPHICIAVFYAVDDDLESVCSRGRD
jgi:hypothetical protein